MPIYEYGCDGCGRQFEVTQKISEAPLKTCPACGKDLLQKLISPTAFVLKGGGWYKDGYGSTSDKKPRTENQRADRLQKAIDDDKKKTAKSEPSSSSSSSSSDSSSGTGTSSGTKSDKSSAVHA